MPASRPLDKTRKAMPKVSFDTVSPCTVMADHSERGIRAHHIKNVNAGGADFGQAPPCRRRSRRPMLPEQKAEDGLKLLSRSDLGYLWDGVLIVFRQFAFEILTRLNSRLTPFKLTIPEYHKRRNGTNVVHGRQLLVLVDIDFDDAGFITYIAGQFLENRVHHLTGSAPSCEKINQDRLVRVDEILKLFHSHFRNLFFAHYRASIILAIHQFFRFVKDSTNYRCFIDAL